MINISNVKDLLEETDGLIILLLALFISCLLTGGNYETYNPLDIIKENGLAEPIMTFSALLIFCLFVEFICYFGIYKPVIKSRREMGIILVFASIFSFIITISQGITLFIAGVTAFIVILIFVYLFLLLIWYSIVRGIESRLKSYIKKLSECDKSSELKKLLDKMENQESKEGKNKD
ncbi:hypothetical protein BEH94_09215 [Candidatus Altiarchaeales archaeon WOR_SM1_SCG]|nr:hypothetical protein BEH94_09215 [Candidatus Altiarchaeales archaeon WOR_SM1_SCG]